MKTLLLASALFAGLFVCLSAAPSPAPVPYNAFCKLIWTFATPCGEINNKMVQQIQAFNLQSGQYTLMLATPLFIMANHTSLDGVQTETLTFSFIPDARTGGCRVTAHSTSLGFTSSADSILNYCNLHNLVLASGLMSEPGFKEKTNEWACLGYRQATCKA